jgi:hypothetical protein
MTKSLLLASLAAICFLFASCRVTNSQTDQETAIDHRIRASNGITVGEPKVYDDSLLQQMLNSAEAQLSSLQVLNQTGISANFGAVTGASQQFSSFAVSAQGGPPMPQSVLTNNGATTQVANTAAPTGNSVVTTTTAPAQNTTTTLSPPAAALATPPAATTSLPSSYSVSASNILNEQMQVTYEIANLRLLVEGPLSDRMLNTSDGKTFMKPRTTLGFPITITPDKRFKDAVAVVEVEVETAPNEDLSGPKQSPSITALLPREKTYNVAAIMDHNTSLGGGIATQLAGVSVAFLHSRKSYYVVQDQDTLALTFSPEQHDAKAEPRIGFLWQFRPVLGSDYVQSGLKQTFVQLSFPSPKSASSLGKIHVRTYWRKYDRDTGLLKEVVQNSLDEDAANSDIPVFDMKQNIADFSPKDLEDLGNGQMLVNVPGIFLGGTYIRVGSTILQPGSAGFTSEYRRLRFIAPIADLATKDVFIVARDGTEKALRIKNDCDDKPKNLITIKSTALEAVDESNTKSDCYDKLKNPITIRSTPFEAIDESNTLLKVEMEPFRSPITLPLTLVVGGKVLGYSDAPIRREGDTLSVVLPTSFLVANPVITVKPLLVDDRFFATTSIVPAGTEAERLVLLQQGTKLATYLLFGRELDHVVAVSPKIPLHSVGTGEADDSLRQIEIPIATAKSLKEIILQRDKERPFIVAVPAAAATDQAKQTLKFQESVTVGADEAVVIGDGLSSISKAQFQKKDLVVVKSGDGKPITLKGLAAAGATASARTVDIDLIPAAGKATTIKLVVVNSKVETTSK